VSRKKRGPGRRRSLAADLMRRWGKGGVKWPYHHRINYKVKKRGKPRAGREDLGHGLLVKKGVPAWGKRLAAFPYFSATPLVILIWVRKKEN